MKPTFTIFAMAVSCLVGFTIGQVETERIWMHNLHQEKIHQECYERTHDDSFCDRMIEVN